MPTSVTFVTDNIFSLSHKDLYILDTGNTQEEVYHGSWGGMVPKFITKNTRIRTQLPCHGD